MTAQIRSAIKNAMITLFPRTATQMFSARARAYSHALSRKWGCTDLNSRLIDRLGNRVLHGPFTGIALSSEACREHLAPFLLGTYESELNEAWDTIFKMEFSQLLDVGAKFGFYAVGLARRFPGIPVFAFDTDPWARKATTEMSIVNDVEIKVHGYCSRDWMCEHLQERAFVLSDCEGFEAKLFGSGPVPNLTSATMLIELHEQFSPGVTRLLQATYAPSHEIEIISAQLGTIDSPPELAFLSEAERRTAAFEFRTGDQSWMFLRPKT